MGSHNKITIIHTEKCPICSGIITLSVIYKNISSSFYKGSTSVYHGIRSCSCLPEVIVFSKCEQDYNYDIMCQFQAELTKAVNDWIDLFPPSLRCHPGDIVEYDNHNQFTAQSLAILEERDIVNDKIVIRPMINYPDSRLIIVEDFTETVNLSDISPSNHDYSKHKRIKSTTTHKGELKTD